MRKITKPEEKCSCCGQVTKHAKTAEFCDQCKQKLPENMYPLEMTVFIDSTDRTKMVSVCSWKCARAYFISNQRKLTSKKIDFLSLPYPTGKLNNQKESKQYCDSIENFYKEFLSIVPKPTESKQA